MILRNSEGIIKIISRKDCKNENVYNKKIVEIMNEYTKRYKSVITPTEKKNETKTNNNSKPNNNSKN